jgi:hypothetical protein
MAGKVLNLAASVHQRLLNRAKASFHPFGGLLQHFAIERFLYRLSRSRHVDRFILKGALMLPIWSGVASRGRRVRGHSRTRPRHGDLSLAPGLPAGPIGRLPEALQAPFAQDPAKQIQWQAFTVRSQIADAPKALADVVTQVKTFLQPILTALAAGQPFKGQWKALGPWD